MTKNNDTDIKDKKGMSYQQTLEFLMTLDKPTFSIMLEADHAQGKSALIKEFAKKRNYFFIDCRLGQREAGDVIGYPHVTSDNHFIHILSELIRPAFEPTPKDYDGIVLFFDELNRATKDVIQCVFEPCLDRTMNGKPLNENCFVFAAINDNLNKYTVTELDPALVTRFCVIKFEPTVAEWLKWGETTGELAPEVIFLIKDQINLADPALKADLNELTQPHPNRRSWHMFSNYLEKNRGTISSDMVMKVCACFVGPYAAEIFKIAYEEMDESIKGHNSNANKEKKKIENIMDKFFKSREWSNVVLKNEVEKLNTSELDLFKSSVILYYNDFQSLSQSAKIRMKELVEIAKPEFIKSIWSSLTKDIKDKLINYDSQTFNNIK